MLVGTYLVDNFSKFKSQGSGPCLSYRNKVGGRKVSTNGRERWIYYQATELRQPQGLDRSPGRAEVDSKALEFSFLLTIRATFKIRALTCAKCWMTEISSQMAASDRGTEGN